MEERVNQIPYISESTYPRVMGTNKSCIKMLIPLTKRDPMIFVFTAFVLLLPEKKLCIKDWRNIIVFKEYFPFFL